MLSERKNAQEAELPDSFDCVLRGNQLQLLTGFISKQFDVNDVVHVDDLNVFLKYHPHLKLDDQAAKQRWSNISLLHVAALLHDESMVNLLIKSGATITQAAKDDIEDNFSPYYFAEINLTKNDISEDLYINLLRIGDYPPPDNSHPYWYYVIKRNHIQLLKFLLNTKFLKQVILGQNHNPGILQNHIFEYSYPLHFAALLGRYKIVEMLLQSKEDVNARLMDGPSDSEQEDMVPANTVIELPLYGAVKGNHIEVVKLLLKHKADITLAEEHNEARRPLDCAAFYGFNDILKCLCQAKANVSLGDEDKLTPAHHAALGGNKVALQILTEYKADILSADKKGYTILDYALLGGHLNLYEDLKKEFPILLTNLALDMKQYKLHVSSQQLIFSCLKEFYGQYTQNFYKSGTNIIFFAQRLGILLKSLCQPINDHNYYDNVVKFIKKSRNEAGFQNVKLLDILIFSLSGEKKQEILKLFDANLQPYVNDVVTYKTELADMFFAIANDHTMQILFQAFQQARQPQPFQEYGSQFSCYTQAAFANEFDLFRENAKINQDVMHRLNICFTDIKYIEPNRDMLLFMQTCKNPLLLKNKSSAGSIREYPLAIMFFILTFLQPDYITHNKVKIASEKIAKALDGRCKKARVDLPANSQFQKEIISKLIQYYEASGEDTKDTVIVKKRQIMSESILQDIKTLASKLQSNEEKFIQEQKSDSASVLMNVALLEQALLQECINVMKSKSIKNVDNLFESGVILRNLNKLILIKNNKHIYRLYSVRERRDYVNGFFNPVIVQVKQGNLSDSAKRARR